jgi:acyl-CoA synthetase (AMP-forming)/AMP-acid ligase II
LTGSPPKGELPDSMHAESLTTPGATGHERWKTELYSALRGKAEPAIVLPDATISAASLWVASRHWVDFFRELGMQPGDRVTLRWHPSAGFLAFLIASICEGLCIAVIPPGMTESECLHFFDARLGLGCHGLTADNAGCPLTSASWSLRTASGPTDSDIRLLLRTCGTSGHPAWVALSDTNIWSVLDAHRPHLVRREDVVLSVLPWFHSFGLIIDLLPALLGAGIIVRDPSAGKEPVSILSTAAAFSATWCSMVPLQAQRLAATDEGLEFLRSLRGGVIGGASASRQLAEAINGTHLFVGYGQTEASPGITLGQPGNWVPGAIGAPIGCDLRVDDGGRLHVRGNNVCAGFWSEKGLTRREGDRWLDTGDIVESRGGELIFLGRGDHNFKLANGRMVDAAAIESRLRDADSRIVDCAIVSRDSFTIRVYIVMNHPAASPDADRVRSVLGALADRLDEIIVLPESPEIRSSKGALDRLKLVRDHGRVPVLVA